MCIVSFVSCRADDDSDELGSKGAHQRNMSVGSVPSIGALSPGGASGSTISSLKQAFSGPLCTQSSGSIGASGAQRVAQLATTVDGVPTTGSGYGSGVSGAPNGASSRASGLSSRAAAPGLSQRAGTGEAAAFAGQMDALLSANASANANEALLAPAEVNQMVLALQERLKELSNHRDLIAKCQPEFASFLSDLDNLLSALGAHVCSPAPQHAPVAASASASSATLSVASTTTSTSASKNGGASPAATTASAHTQLQSQAQQQQRAPAPQLAGELLSRTKDLRQSFMLFKITSDAMLKVSAPPRRFPLPSPLLSSSRASASHSHFHLPFPFPFPRCIDLLIARAGNALLCSASRRRRPLCFAVR